MNMERIMELGSEMGMDFAVRLASAIAIFVLGRWAARLGRRLTVRMLKRYQVEETLERFLGNIVHAALLTVVIVAAVNRLGVETTSVVAIVGAAGLAVGLALQGSLSNFAAGVLIVLFQPYRVGDYVEAAGVAGNVQEVQIFTTLLRTPDNKTVIVPNSQIMNGTIVNYTANDTRRIDLQVGCGYGDDLDAVRSALTAVVSEHPGVLAEPAPTIAVAALGESSVDFVVRPWVKSADYWNVRFDLTEKIKNRFDADGLSIPYPQRDVHVHRRES
jgi:small conductance mechanosensitive channel